MDLRGLSGLHGIHAYWGCKGYKGVLNSVGGLKGLMHRSSLFLLEGATFADQCARRHTACRTP